VYGDNRPEPAIPERIVDGENASTPDIYILLFVSVLDVNLKYVTDQIMKFCFSQSTCHAGSELMFGANGEIPLNKQELLS
jgi:hypothetical protein